MPTPGVFHVKSEEADTHMRSYMGMTRTFHIVSVQTGEGTDFLASICVPAWEQLGSRYTSNPLFHLDNQVISSPSEPKFTQEPTSDTPICTPVEDDIQVPSYGDQD